MYSLFNKIKTFLTTQNNFLKILLIFLLLDYILLFAAESILPGLVMRFFNLNIFLATIIALWILFIFTREKKAEKESSLFYFAVILSAIILFITLFFAFLGISYFEMAIYFFFIILLGFLAFKLIK